MEEEGFWWGGQNSNIILDLFHIKDLQADYCDNTVEKCQREQQQKKMLLNPIKFQRAVWLHLSVLPRALVKCFVLLQVEAFN